MPKHLLHDELSRCVIGAFFEVYNTLGFGFLEHIYTLALERELRARGRKVAREMGVLVMYKGEPLGNQRVDMLVDDKLVVETKSTFLLPPTSRRQLFNYLRATNLELGLLLHFGPEPKFHRIIYENRLRRNPSHPFNP